MTGDIEPANADDVRLLLMGDAGKVVLVNLWATWCAPCVAEMPEFAQFYRQYAPEGVQLISLSADGAANIEVAVRPFKKEHNLPFPIHVLTMANPDELAPVLKTTLTGALPVTFLYDQQGHLVKTWEEGVTCADLKAAVTPLLQPGGSAPRT